MPEIPDVIGVEGLQAVAEKPGKSVMDKLVGEEPTTDPGDKMHAPGLDPADLPSISAPPISTKPEVSPIIVHGGNKGGENKSIASRYKLEPHEYADEKEKFPELYEALEDGKSVEKIMREISSASPIIDYNRDNGRLVISMPYGPNLHGAIFKDRDGHYILNTDDMNTPIPLRGHGFATKLTSEVRRFGEDIGVDKFTGSIKHPGALAARGKVYGVDNLRLLGLDYNPVDYDKAMKILSSGGYIRLTVNENELSANDNNTTSSKSPSHPPQTAVKPSSETGLPPDYQPVRESTPGWQREAVGKAVIEAGTSGDLTEYDRLVSKYGYDHPVTQMARDRLLDGGVDENRLSPLNIKTRTNARETAKGKGSEAERAKNWLEGEKDKTKQKVDQRKEERQKPATKKEREEIEQKYRDKAEEERKQREEEKENERLRREGTFAEKSKLWWKEHSPGIGKAAGNVAKVIGGAGYLAGIGAAKAVQKFDSYDRTEVGEAMIGAVEGMVEDFGIKRTPESMERMRQVADANKKLADKIHEAVVGTPGVTSYIEPPPSAPPAQPHSTEPTGPSRPEPAPEPTREPTGPTSKPEPGKPQPSPVPPEQDFEPKLKTPEPTQLPNPELGLEPDGPDRNEKKWRDRVREWRENRYMIDGKPVSKNEMKKMWMEEQKAKRDSGGNGGDNEPERYSPLPTQKQPSIWKGKLPPSPDWRIDGDYGDYDEDHKPGRGPGWQLDLPDLNSPGNSPELLKPPRGINPNAIQDAYSRYNQLLEENGPAFLNTPEGNKVKTIINQRDPDFANQQNLKAAQDFLDRYEGE